MEQSPILNPSGEPVFIYGGERAHSTRQYKSYVVSYEWTRSNRKTYRVLCIWPQRSILLPGSMAAGAWTISEMAMVDFLEADRDGKATGRGTEHLFREALAAMPLLGKDRNDKHAFTELVDTVIRWGPDLALIPAAPPAIRRRLRGDPMWDVTATNKNTGKTISEASV